MSKLLKSRLRTANLLIDKVIKGKILLINIITNIKLIFELLKVYPKFPLNGSKIPKKMWKKSNIFFKNKYHYPLNDKFEQNIRRY